MGATSGMSSQSLSERSVLVSVLLGRGRGGEELDHRELPGAGLESCRVIGMYNGCDSYMARRMILERFELSKVFGCSLDAPSGSCRTNSPLAAADDEPPSRLALCLSAPQTNTNRGLEHH